jgi:DNA invertase Pin-like site-specific DNA recombinase
MSNGKPDVPAPPNRLPVRAFGADKIQPRHHEKMALVYVRQSSPHQVLHHRESTDLQYKLVERAAALGWRPEQIQVIDDDLGVSGRTIEGRLGFQRLLAELSQDRVGLVLGIEMSRLARSCKDWYYLLELCALFGSLLADQDGLYDPSNYNDRLLLGLKGTMSEAELHLLQSRMLQGKLNKARRGDLFSHPPIGYIRDVYQGVIMDPDEQVQQVVRLVFESFAEQGTVNAVVRYFRKNDIRLGIRPHSGPKRGQLHWRQASRGTVRNLLRHPIYAGAYAYGRFQVDPRSKLTGHTQRWEAEPDEWLVLIKDRLPAFIAWEQYEKNRQQLADNQARASKRGAPRNGAALLNGIARCAKCNGKMSASYGGPKRDFRYCCDKNGLKNQGRGCQTLSGSAVDTLVRDQIFKVLKPAALELSFQAAAQVQHERDRLHRHWQQRLQRGRYDAELAQRRYEAVDPSNRLVALNLEKQWELALQKLHEEETAHADFVKQQPQVLTNEQKKDIRALAEEIPALWNADSTQPVDRQEIARLLIDAVEIDIQGHSERMELTIHWAGGFTSRHAGLRRIHRFEQLHNFDQLRARARELRGQRHSCRRIAEMLNDEGFRSPLQDEKLSAHSIRALLRNDDKSTMPLRRKSFTECLESNERWLQDLATELKMPYASLHAWIRRGWIVTRQIAEAGGMHAATVTAQEIARLRRLRDHRKQSPYEKPTLALTTPLV